MSDRIDQINELIKQELAKEIHFVLHDQIISITAVETSRDLSFAKVWISSLDNTENAVALCQHQSSFLTRALAKKLFIKKVPKLRFFPDNSPDQVEKIEKLLNDIRNE